MKDPVVKNNSSTPSGGGPGLAARIGRPIEKQVASITEIDISVREAMRDGPHHPGTHRRFFSQVPALWETELGGAGPIRERADAPVRVAVWNVERLRHVEA